jgi:hypothetical protein
LIEKNLKIDSRNILRTYTQQRRMMIRRIRRMIRNLPKSVAEMTIRARWLKIRTNYFRMF